jgi:hypothetical protein
VEELVVGLPLWLKVQFVINPCARCESPPPILLRVERDRPHNRIEPKVLQPGEGGLLTDSRGLVVRGAC